jgi:hypothetical protein
VPVAQRTYPIAPPLAVTRPRRNSRSRSSTLRQELPGTGGGLAEHPPPDPLARAVPVVGEQLVQTGAGELHRRFIDDPTR